jgi:8-oxo-dGTP diphosphatase
MPNTVPDAVVHVAVGVLVNPAREILVARRHQDQHQGGLWEFPGGKVAPGESVQQALKRELKEEVNIVVRECASLLKIHHDYGDKQVLLDVWYVHLFAGDARGCEGQPVRWVSVPELETLEFPAANQGIVAAVRNLLA